jgi:hypothetical protein
MKRAELDGAEGGDVVVVVVVVAEKAIGDVDVVNASTTAASVATMTAVVVKVFIVLFWNVVVVPCR